MDRGLAPWVMDQRALTRLTIWHRRGGAKKPGPGRKSLMPAATPVATRPLPSGSGSGFARFPEHPHQLAVQGLVAGDNVAGQEWGLAALEVGDEAAGFTHQDETRRDVPGRKVALPVGIEAPGRQPGKVERGGPEPAQAGDLLLHGGDLLAGEREIAAAEMRQPAGDDRVREPLARRHPQPPIVEEGALAALGGEQFLVRRIVDQAGHDGALALERDRDREVRDPVQEVGGAVERIDDPAVRLVGAFVGAAFLAEKAVAGARVRELLAHDFLGAPVGGGDEIGGALERDLQMLHLAEVALEHAAGLARGFDPHVEEGGAEHGALSRPSCAGLTRASTSWT